MQEAKDKSRKELLSKREPALDLENSQSVQIAKDAKVCSGDRTKVWLDTLLLNILGV